MSKDLFLMMREEEVATLNFLPTKKEIANTSKKFAEKIIENAEHNPQEVYAQAIRLKEALSVIESVLKGSLPEENFEAFGLKGTYRSGGESINYSEDEVYSELKNNDETLKLFEDDDTKETVKLLFCINMLNEGLHIGNLDGVIFLRPTTSPNMYYQQIGRAMDAGRSDQTLILDLVNQNLTVRTAL